MRTAAIDCSKQGEAIQQILGQNAHLRGRIEILRAHWPKKAIRLNKAVTYLILDMATPEQANLLVDEGLLFQSELKECELYHGDCRVTQCYNCQKYGHTARICRFNKKCGLCAAPGHDDKTCSFRNDPTKHRCVNCNLNHPAWSSNCAVRREQAEKARLAYATRPRRYASPISGLRSSLASASASSCTPSLSPPSSSAASSHSTTSVPNSQEEEAGRRMDGIQVGPVRSSGQKRTRSISARSQADSREASQTRRGPGRPPNRPRAASDDQDIASFFTQNDDESEL
jgi:hypothetical protein